MMHAIVYNTVDAISDKELSFLDLIQLVAPRVAQKISTLEWIVEKNIYQVQIFMQLFGVCNNSLLETMRILFKILHKYKNMKKIK